MTELGANPSNIDPGTDEVPMGWDPADGGATAGYTDYVGPVYGGPAPPSAERPT